MKKKGFTLIELMIVITIIGLLIGILVPAVMAALEIASRMRCASNLGQIGKALYAYAGAHDGRYPDVFESETGWNEVGNTRTDQWDFNTGSWPPATTIAAEDNDQEVLSNTANLWVLVSQEYAKEVTIFICPSAEETLADLTAKGYEGDLRDFRGRPFISYSYQNQLGRYRSKQLADPGLPLAADANPQREDFTRTGEGDEGPTSLYFTNAATKPKFVREEWQKEELEAEHECNSPNHKFKGQNVLFADGHAAFHVDPYCGIAWDNIWTKHKDDATVTDINDITTIRPHQETASYGSYNDKVLDADDGFLVP